MDYGGRIAFFIDDAHRVYVEKAPEETSDPVIDRFLTFLAQDMARDPGTSIVPVSSALRARWRRLCVRWILILMRRLMGCGAVAMTIINGWIILAHPLFLDQLERLTQAVEALKAKAPDRYRQNANTKLLAALYKLVFQQVPSDPTLPQYRQGSTLGSDYRHWFRVKLATAAFACSFATTRPRRSSSTPG